MQPHGDAMRLMTAFIHHTSRRPPFIKTRGTGQSTIGSIGARLGLTQSSSLPSHPSTIRRANCNHVPPEPDRWFLVQPHVRCRLGPDTPPCSKYELRSTYRSKAGAFGVGVGVGANQKLSFRPPNSNGTSIKQTETFHDPDDLNKTMASAPLINTHAHTRFAVSTNDKQKQTTNHFVDRPRRPWPWVTHKGIHWVVTGHRDFEPQSLSSKFIRYRSKTRNIWLPVKTISLRHIYKCSWEKSINFTEKNFSAWIQIRLHSILQMKRDTQANVIKWQRLSDKKVYNWTLRTNT